MLAFVHITSDKCGSLSIMISRISSRSTRAKSSGGKGVRQVLGQTVGFISWFDIEHCVSVRRIVSTSSIYRYDIFDAFHDR